MEDWDDNIEGDTEGAESLAEGSGEDWEEEIIEESEEPLETIIDETPTVSYPRSSATNRWPSPESSITPEFSQSQEPLETGIQETQTPTPTQELQTAENAPEYSSITYQETRQKESQTEAGYPEQIHLGSQTFSPSLPQHLLQSQFSTIPGTIQQRDMSGELEQIKPKEKEYQAGFEQNKKDRRRF